MCKTGLSDHKEYSTGHKIPFLMNLPSPVGPRGLGLGLSGKLTPVINCFPLLNVIWKTTVYQLKFEKLKKKKKPKTKFT